MESRRKRALKELDALYGSQGAQASGSVHPTVPRGREPPRDRRESSHGAANTDTGFYAQLPKHMASHLEQEQERHEFVWSFVKEAVEEGCGRSEEHVEPRLQDRIVLLDNPRPDVTLEATRRRQLLQEIDAHRRGAMSSRARKAARLHTIPSESARYAQFLPLHQLWVQYFEEVFTGTSPAAVPDRLTKADYHGCLMRVVRARCPSYVGVEGIVVQESENAFRMVTRRDKLKLILKPNTVFEFTFRNQPVTLFGSQFCFRCHERSSRKFKAKPFAV